MADTLREKIARRFHISNWSGQGETVAMEWGKDASQDRYYNDSDRVINLFLQELKKVKPLGDVRENILEELVQSCTWVDSCGLQCTPADHENCYGHMASAIKPLVEAAQQDVIGPIESLIGE